MKDDCGFIIVVNVIIGVLTLIVMALGVYWYQSYTETEKRTIPVKQEIEEALISSPKIKEMNLEGGDVVISSIYGDFSRGQITSLVTGFKADFFAVKSDDEWQIVSVTDEPVFCERMERIGFSPKLIYDCALEYPGATTIDDLLVDIQNNINVFFTNIIGTIAFIDDPACVDCVQITSGGASVVVEMDQDQVSLDGITDGDTVVIAVDVSGDGNTIIASEIEEVDDMSIGADISNISNGSSNLGDLDNSNDSAPTDNLGSSDSPGGSDDDTIYPDDYGITNLPPNVGFTNGKRVEGLYDIDNSSIDIKIISDF